MIEGISDPVAYGLAVVCFGGWILVAWFVRLVFAGKLRTRDELIACQDRAEAAEKALRVRDEQVDAALAVLPKVADVLTKFHAAGEEVRREQERQP